MPDPPPTLLLYDSAWRYALARYAPATLLVLLRCEPQMRYLTGHWALLWAYARAVEAWEIEVLAVRGRILLEQA